MLPIRVPGKSTFWFTLLLVLMACSTLDGALCRSRRYPDDPNRSEWL